MVQPPEPGEAQGGHPEPEPLPVPEPEPPQPIPPPDPLPVPEPPHLAAHRTPTDFIDAPPAPPPLEFPPVGAYPGEPGHPATEAPTEQLQPVAAQQTAEFQRPAELRTAETHLTEPQPTMAQPTATQPTTAQPTVAQPTVAQPTEAQPTEAQPTEAQATETHATEAHATETHATEAQATEVQAAAAQATEAWQQPPPGEPFHAQHEKTGEWQTHPPEHLSREHSPPAEVVPQTDPVWAGNPAPSWQVPLEAPDKRRGGLWVSLALTLTLLLCGGGGVSAYFLISNADTGKGAPDPATAVNRFMTAVYTQQDASAADDLVCRDARDADRLAARVAQVKNYANAYVGPTFRWDEPAVSAQTDEKATVTVQLTLATDDEKTAQQTLTFTAVHKTGWLVCDIAG